MKYLRFDVHGMKLEKAANADFSGLIAGSRKYLAAMFNFGSDWHGMKKACVWVTGSHETPVPVKFSIAVMDDYTASKADVGLYLVGRGKDGTQVQTNTYWFRQTLGGGSGGKH